MDCQALFDEAARQGYRLVPIDRIKRLEVKLKEGAYLPEKIGQEYIDDYIKSNIVHELYAKMDEYKKIGKFIRRYNKDELYFDIHFSLEVIVPDAPPRRNTTPESNPLLVRGPI